MVYRTCTVVSHRFAGTICRRPRLGRVLGLAGVLILVIASAGCQPGKNKQEVYQHWNSARAGVQGSLAAERYKLGNLEDARKAVDEAIKLDPGNATYRVLSARIYIEKNMLEAADQELATARKLAPRLGDADYLSGIVYQRWQKPDLALTYYSQACEKSPGELQFLMARAEMMMQLGKLDEAVTLVEGKLTYFEYSGPLRDLLGGMYLQQPGKLNQAIEAYHQAAILAPDDVAIHEHLARAYFKANQYRDCLDQIEILSKSEEYQKRADIMVLKGECELQLGQYREARATLETALEIAPTSMSALLCLAKVSIRTNDLDRADICFRKAATIDAQDPQVFLGMGYLRMRQEKWADALRVLQKAAQLDPKDPVAVCMIGMVYEKQGNSEAAMQQYGKALQMDPQNSMAKSLLSKAK